MITKELNIIYDSTTTLSTLYKGDNVRYKIMLDKDILGDCDTINFNVYEPNKNIRVFNKNIIDGAVYLPLDNLNQVGIYEIYLWVKNKRNYTQMFYGKLLLEVKELIG